MRPHRCVPIQDTTPPHSPKCRHPRHNLTQDKWLNAGALTDAGNALIEQRFRDLEANPRASVPWEEAKIQPSTVSAALGLQCRAALGVSRC